MKQYKLPLTVNEGRRKRAAPMKINTTPAIAKFPYTLAVAIHTQSLQVFVAEGNPPFYPCPSGLRSEFT